MASRRFYQLIKLTILNLVTIDLRKRSFSGKAVLSMILWRRHFSLKNSGGEQFVIRKNGLAAVKYRDGVLIR